MTGVGTVTRDSVWREATAAALCVLGSYTWPEPAAADGSGAAPEPPPLPGFILSSFSPLVAQAGHGCLTACHGAPPLPDAVAQRTGIVLVSRFGDVQSAAAVAEAVDTGARVGPLLFFQAVPNAVAGYLAAQWGLGGPVVCLSPTGDPVASGVRAARLLIGDGDADQVLVVIVEQAGVNGGRDYATAALCRGSVG